MRLKNVIFDLDGTLLDTTEGVIESVKYTARRLAYPMLPSEELLKFIGPPIQQSFMTYYGADREQAQEAATIFRLHYKIDTLLKAVPYDGIYELCNILKKNNIRMAVATYKREDYALTLLQYFHFEQYCNPMHGADHYNKLKKEDIVQMCMKEMGGNIEDTILIGDTSSDALAAEKVGIPFIAVLYGFGFRSTTEADRYRNAGSVDNPLQIADIVFNY